MNQTQVQAKTFILDLNPKHNPFYRFKLLCNPFHIGTGINQIENGLAMGVPKSSLDKFLPYIGISKEAIRLIKEKTKRNHKYRITLKWDEAKKRGECWITDITSKTRQP